MINLLLNNPFLIGDKVKPIYDSINCFEYGTIYCVSKHIDGDIYWVNIGYSNVPCWDFEIQLAC